MSQQPYVQFHDGQAYPQFGLGTWQMNDDQAERAVKAAIACGYRHIDTAAIYGDERGVGEGIRKSGVAREEICVTTKIWNGRQGYDETLRAFDESDERLGIGMIDLLLIHWPVPSQDLYLETWKAMIRLKKEARVKSIGVSNFLTEHLERIIGETGEVPAVNQIELHPDFQQRDVRDYHAEHHIQIESYSPLGRGRVLDNPVLAGIGQKHGKSATQVVLRWHIQEGLLVFPKSANPEHIEHNFDIFDFALDPEDMQQIAGLDSEDGRIGSHPAKMSMT